jgi:hypothetical protein
MWKQISGDTPFEYDKDQKIFYVTKLAAIHDALGLRIIERPTLPRRADDFDQLFDEFMDEVLYQTTQIEVRHRARLRPISTIVRITDEIRKQIHRYINEIREAIHFIDLRPEKKGVLMSKLNALADEVDRDRTKTEAWTAFTLEVASTTGKVAKELEPIRALSDSIGNLLGKAKELAKRIGLPAPGEKKRIEAPRRQLPAPNKPPDPDELDDDIPF